MDDFIGMLRKKKEYNGEIKKKLEHAMFPTWTIITFRGRHLNPTKCVGCFSKIKKSGVQLDSCQECQRFKESEDGPGRLAVAELRDHLFFLRVN